MNNDRKDVQDFKELGEVIPENLLDLQETIAEWLKTYGPSTSLESCVNWGETITYRLYFYREETDKEYSDRLKQQKRSDELRSTWAVRKEVRDRAKYEELKKRFG